MKTIIGTLVVICLVLAFVIVVLFTLNARVDKMALGLGELGAQTKYSNVALSRLLSEVDELNNTAEGLLSYPPTIHIEHGTVFNTGEGLLVRVNGGSNGEEYSKDE